MSCILCFNYVADSEHYSLYDCGEATMISASEMIQKYFEFHERILSEDVVKNTQTCVCKICWVNLEAFHEFHSIVTANYLPVDEVKYGTDMNASDLIVYDEEMDKDAIDNQMIKVEVISEEYTETEWIEETEVESVKPPVKPLRVKPLPSSSRAPKQVPAQLDSADDQRIRETADMFCEICHDPVESLRDAKSHYKTAHESEGYIICCERRFRQRCRLVEHVNTHYNYSYTCSVCAKTFDSRSYLAKHLALHDNNKQFECAHCPKAFSRKFQVRNHLLSVHIFDNVEPTFLCPVDGCDKKFVNHARLKHHIDYTHSTTKEIICEVCSKTFRTKNAIDEHMKTHLRKDEDRIRCEICGHFLADVKSYRRHVKNHATEQMDNICSYCGKKSPNLNALKKHIRYVHELERNHQCRFCEKSFKRSRNLIDHEAAMHTLQDLYPCTFCSKTFRNQSNMLAHRKKQHPDLYQKPKYMREAD